MGDSRDLFFEAGQSETSGNNIINPAFEFIEQDNLKIRKTYMKNLKISLLILMILSGFSFAGSNGGYAGAFTRIGLGARAMAMGNTGLADEVSGYSFYYNPALSGFLEGKIVSLSHSFMSLDRRFNFIGYSMKIPPGAGFSVGWINSGVSDIDSYNLIGEIGDQIDHSLNAVYFNFARNFNGKFSAGLSIKYLLEDFNFSSDEYNASGWGFDFGAVYKINSGITVAAAVRDIKSKLKANTSKLFEFGGTTIDEFPVLYLAGIRYITPYEWLRVHYDFENSIKIGSKHRLGVEAVYKNLLALRTGLNNGNFTAGAGMGFKLWRWMSRLDYAFIPSVVDEGSSHIFSWQVLLN